MKFRIKADIRETETEGVRRNYFCKGGQNLAVGLFMMQCTFLEGVLFSSLEL